MNSSDEESADPLEFATSKPLDRGKIYFRSRHVQEIQDSEKEHFYYLKAKVRASFTNQDMYNVMICLNKTTGKVADASCHCKGSSMAIGVDM